jgi:rhodanese-related sulfurtransferase
LDILLKVMVVVIMMLGLIALTGCSPSRTTENQAGSQQAGAASQIQTSFSDVDAAQAKKMIDSDKDLQIIDVREPFEYAGGHIPDATLISAGQLPSRLSEIDKTKPVLVYCASGNRSRGASQFLVQSGYSKVYNLKSGIMGWSYTITR